MQTPLHMHRNLFFAGQTSLNKKLTSRKDGGYDFEYAKGQKVTLYKGANKNIIWINSDKREAILKTFKNISSIKNTPAFNKVDRIQYPGKPIIDSVRKPNTPFFKDLGNIGGQRIQEALIDNSLVKNPQRVNTFSCDFGLHNVEHYKCGVDDFNNIYIMRPPKEKDENKALIYIHGGGFLGGSAINDYDSRLYNRFLKMGYTVATVDYNLITKKPFFETMDDIARGVTGAHNILKKEGKEKLLLAGLSAGATAGELMLYSDAYPSVPKFDGFIGMAGGLGDKGIPEDFNEHVIRESVEHRSYSSLIKIGTEPKTDTPALLIAGEQDHNDIPPEGESSRAEFSQKFIKDSRLIYTSGKYSGHGGPQDAIANGEKYATTELNTFLEKI